MAQEETFMIKKRNIIILLLILALLCGATVALFKWDNTPSDNSDDTELSTNDTVYIYQGNEDELSKINVSLPDESFEFVKIEEDKWQITGLEGTAIKNFSIQMLASDLAVLTAKSIVEENCTDFSKYGLDSSTHSISGDFGGVVKTFYAGNETPLGDGYYFKDADSDTVYTVYTTRYSTLFASKESYRDITFVKFDASSVKSLSIAKADSELAVSMMENPIQMGGYTVAGWEMTKPEYHHIDDSRLTTMVLEKLSQISVKSIADDSGNLSAYGLDKPYATITVGDANDVVQKFSISPADNGNYYAVTDGDNSVYVLGGEPFDFVDVKAFDLVSKFAHICNIEDVSTVKVTKADEVYTLAITGEEDSRKYTLNDSEVEESAFKQELYQGVIGLICTGFCSDAVYAQPVVTVEYAMKDGTAVKVEFVDYNDRNYAVFKNGVCTMQILKKDVNSLVETLKNFNK